MLHGKDKTFYEVLMRMLESTFEDVSLLNNKNVTIPNILVLKDNAKSIAPILAGKNDVFNAMNIRVTGFFSYL